MSEVRLATFAARTLCSSTTLGFSTMSRCCRPVVGSAANTTSAACGASTASAKTFDFTARSSRVIFAGASSASTPFGNLSHGAGGSRALDATSRPATLCRKDALAGVLIARGTAGEV